MRNEARLRTRGPHQCKVRAVGVNVDCGYCAQKRALRSACVDDDISEVHQRLLLVDLILVSLYAEANTTKVVRLEIIDGTAFVAIGEDDEQAREAATANPGLLAVE